MDKTREYYEKLGAELLAKSDAELLGMIIAAEPEPITPEKLFNSETTIGECVSWLRRNGADEPFYLRIETLPNLPDVKITENGG